MSLLDRLLGRDPLPDGATGPLDPDENVLAHAELVAGGHVVATSFGLWFPDDATVSAGPRLLPWHLVSKAAWQGGAIALVEATERETVGAAVVLADLPPRRLRLGAEPGRLPQVVHERVEASIRSRHHRDLPGGGAWFVQRKVAGRGGYVLQVRPDPGTDLDAVRQVAVDVARALGWNT